MIAFEWLNFDWLNDEWSSGSNWTTEHFGCVADCRCKRYRQLGSYCSFPTCRKCWDDPCECTRNLYAMPPEMLISLFNQALLCFTLNNTFPRLHNARHIGSFGIFVFDNSLFKWCALVKVQLCTLLHHHSIGIRFQFLRKFQRLSPFPMNHSFQLISQLKW